MTYRHGRNIIKAAEEVELVKVKQGGLVEIHVVLPGVNKTFLRACVKCIKKVFAVSFISVPRRLSFLRHPYIRSIILPIYDFNVLNLLN